VFEETNPGNENPLGTILSVALGSKRMPLGTNKGNPM